MNKISVVMSVYNGEKTVKKAVQSILDGSFRNLEFIIINDGSDDGTRDILEQAVAADDRIRLFNFTQNKGLIYALNFGIGKSCGDYIARMDADDVARVDRLQTQYDCLKDRNDIVFVGSAARLVDEDGKVWGVRSYPKTVDKKLLMKYDPFIHPTLLFKKSALEAVGGYRDSERTYRCEDYDLIFRLYAQGLYGENLEEPLIDYRESLNSAKKHNRTTRKNEYYVRKEGVKILKGGIYGRLFSLKPLCLSLLPDNVYNFLHNKKWKGKR